MVPDRDADDKNASDIYVPNTHLAFRSLKLGKMRLTLSN